jgi:hypothetical protein
LGNARRYGAKEQNDLNESHGFSADNEVDGYCTTSTATGRKLLDLCADQMRTVPKKHPFMNCGLQYHAEVQGDVQSATRSSDLVRNRLPAPLGIVHESRPTQKQSARRFLRKLSAG